MNRSHYFNYIEERISFLAFRIEQRGKLNILDLHLHSENFYMHLMNHLFGLDLINMNAIQQNVEAIDLIDSKNKIIIQVSATAKKNKIQSALSKDHSDKEGYLFKFISISKDATNLKKQSYEVPKGLSFNPKSDIFDINGLFKIVLSLDIDRQKVVFDFIRSELGNEIDINRIDSNLTLIINYLSNENWDSTVGVYEINAFEIERKINHNNLQLARMVIEDYAANSSRLDKIYDEFNKLGNNKSISVLSSIRNIYIRHCESDDADSLFFMVIEKIIDRVMNSNNNSSIPFEELEMCVNILVVDAFIRCKIFKNPVRYNYVAA